MKTLIKVFRIIIVVMVVMFIFDISSSSINFKVVAGKVVKAYEKSRIIKNVENYEVYETDSFIIRYENDKETAEVTAKILNKYYNKICDMFNYYPKEKVNIIIYNNGDELLKNTRMKKDNPPLGVYYCETINILSPKLWIDQNNNFQEIYEKRGPVVHELTHYFVDNITNGNYPMWLTEGIALYIENKTTGYEWGVGLEDHKDITIQELTRNFHNISPTLSYRRSYEIVESISDNWGFTKITLLLDTLGKGKSMSKSTKKVLKIELEDIGRYF